ncbi:MAG: family 14 glycosylhydrolase [Thermoguttaceae bacterium]|jgi:hypothetical protein
MQHLPTVRVVLVLLTLTAAACCASTAADDNPPRVAPQPMILATSAGDAESIRKCKELGFTIFQTDSDHLTTNETAPGHWDWTAYDEALKQVRSQSVQWMFFPHFAWPTEWCRKNVAYTRLRCLEHDQTVEAFSLWDPKATECLEEGYRALAEHYRGGAHDIAALYLGVHGDYGECMFPAACRMGDAGQKADWQKRFGDLHDHYGYWCGDKLARAHFRQSMVAKYGSLEKLNRASGTAFDSREQITYPGDMVKQRRWRLDFIRWYLDSMVEYARAVAKSANKHFPETIKMFPLGAGDEDPRVGQDQSALVKMAHEEHVQIRSTHGGFRPFAQNASSQLVRIATACKHYQVPFWSEPPSRITPEGEVSRIFESICCGAAGFWDWSVNPIAAAEQFKTYRPLMLIDPPVVEVAVLFPQTDHYLHPAEVFPQRFLDRAAELRDLVHFDILDEALIRSGALKNYRYLVHLDGSVFERSTLETIDAWVQRGGVFCALPDGKVETVEGESSLAARLFAGGDASGPAAVSARGAGAVCGVSGGAAHKEAYFELLQRVFYTEPPGSNRKPVESVDRDRDGVYGVVLRSGRALVHNPSGQEKLKAVDGRQFRLPPASIVEVRRPAQQANPGPAIP